ncbi:hypothetical protein DFQ29_000660 [Apophysomyces sp. BC1021]|nr:hypothetical protein DFQ29_000660 [Apophysomyces sp. BC1021]
MIKAEHIQLQGHDQHAQHQLQLQQCEQQQMQLQQQMMQDLLNRPQNPIVSSQTALDNSQQNAIHQAAVDQQVIEAHQEAVAAAAQQVMAHQMAAQQAAAAQQMALMQQQVAVIASSQHPSPHNQVVEQQESTTLGAVLQSTAVTQQSPEDIFSMMKQQNMDPMVSMSFIKQETPHVVLSQMSNTHANAIMLQQTNEHRMISRNPASAPQNIMSQQQQQVPCAEKSMVFVNRDANGTATAKRTIQDETIGESRKKARRHTLSSPYLPHLNIQTNNLPNQGAPHSALVMPHDDGEQHILNNSDPERRINFGSSASTPGSRESEMTPPMFSDDQNALMMRRLAKGQQKQPLQIELPPPPTPAELGLEDHEAKVKMESSDCLEEGIAVSAAEYESMSKEELIARLVVLEQEKRTGSQQTSPTEAGVAESSSRQAEIAQEVMAEMRSEASTNADEEEGPSTPSDAQESRGIGSVAPETEEKVEEVDEGEEEDDDELESEHQEENEEPKEQVQCRWRDCGEKFDELKNLISHISEAHVGSGKPTYSCEWEGCSRNQKPFTKRHKMYNHLRTHTGERPFVCPKDGCGKRFSRPDSLTTHIKTHSNVRPYICPAKGCGKAYYHSRSLKKHEKIHEAQQMAASSSGVSYTATTAYNLAGPVPADYLNHQMSTMPVQAHHQHQHPSHPHQQALSITLSLPLPHQHHPSHPNSHSSSPHQVHPYSHQYQMSLPPPPPQLPASHVKPYTSASNVQPYSPSGMVEPSSNASTLRGNYESANPGGYSFQGT